MAYFSNGCEGDALHSQCAECPLGKHEDAPCPILLLQNVYNYKQVSNPDLRAAMNLLIDQYGRCMMKPEIEKYVTKDIPKPVRARDILPSMLDWAKERGIV